MYRCIVTLRDLEEAEALTVLINKYKRTPKKSVWQDSFWEERFESRQDWGVSIVTDGPEVIDDFSYCDIPWYENNPPYRDTDFLHLEEFIEILEPEESKEPFIKTISMEEIYNGLK